MNKKIGFFIYHINRIILGSILSLFIKKDKNLILLGISHERFFNSKSEKKENFMHNTKYLLLNSVMNPDSELKVVYLCDDKNKVEKFHSLGIKNVYTRNSLKGLWSIIKGKYWLYDYSSKCIANPLFAKKSTCINFWHGTSWKKIGADNYSYSKLSPTGKKIYELLMFRDDYFITNNDFEQKVYKTAFFMPEDKMPILCSPRLDVLYKHFEHEELFMEEDYFKIKKLHKEGKKLIIYMPTYRDTGKDVSSWLKSDKLKELLKANNAVLLCKLHPADVNSLNFELSEDFYKMDNNTDVYPVLKFTEGLITDFSSIALDYLILDKPIIYYVPDLKEYQEQCHKFYVEYDEFVAGEKASDEQALFASLKNILSGSDNFAEQRKKLKEKVFKFDDGKNCERVWNFIKELNK